MKKIALSLLLVFATQTGLSKEVDVAKTEFKWTGSKVKGKHYGKVPLKNHSLEYKKDKLIGGEFVLDLANFTVDDLQGKWAKKFLTHMKSKDFFEIEKWPTAKLKITKLGKKKAHGELTIKDKTKKVKIPYTKEGKTFSGVLKFDRTKFGMIYGSGNFFKNLGDKMINNEVTVDFKVVLK